MDPVAAAREFSRNLGKTNSIRRKELASAYSEWVGRRGFMAKATNDAGTVELCITHLVEKNNLPYFRLGDGSLVLAVGQDVS